MLIKPAEAASNGSNDPASTPELKTGLAYVRESADYHLANIAHDSAYEATSLCMDIYRAASDAHTHSAPTGSQDAPVLADPGMQLKIKEALDCLYLAQDYLQRLIVRDDPPF
jgi:hypothetical protein